MKRNVSAICCICASILHFVHAGMKAENSQMTQRYVSYRRSCGWRASVTGYGKLWNLGSIITIPGLTIPGPSVHVQPSLLAIHIFAGRCSGLSTSTYPTKLLVPPFFVNVQSKDRVVLPSSKTSCVVLAQRIPSNWTVVGVPGCGQCPISGDSQPC